MERLVELILKERRQRRSLMTGPELHDLGRTEQAFREGVTLLSVYRVIDDGESGVSRTFARVAPLVAAAKYTRAMTMLGEAILGQVALPRAGERQRIATAKDGQDRKDGGAGHWTAASRLEAALRSRRALATAFAELSTHHLAEEFFPPHALSRLADGDLRGAVLAAIAAREGWQEAEREADEERLARIRIAKENLDMEQAEADAARLSEDALVAPEAPQTLH